MDVVKKARFDEAAIEYPKYADALRYCYDHLIEATPTRFQDLKNIFGRNLDLFTHRSELHWVVIDISRNKLRLIGGVNYKRQKFYVKHIYLHADYDVATQWYNSHPRGTKP